MKIINNMDELKGKTIESALTVDHREHLSIKFTDGTSVFFYALYRGDDQMDISLDDEPDDDVKLIAGVMDREEFLLIQKRKDEKVRQAREFDAAARRGYQLQAELQQLANLKAKYEGG